MSYADAMLNKLVSFEKAVMQVVHIFSLIISLSYNGVTFDLGNGLDLTGLSLFSSNNVKLSDIFSMDGPRGDVSTLEDLPKSLITNEVKPSLKKPSKNAIKETFHKSSQANLKMSENSRKNTQFEKKLKSKKMASKSPAKLEVTSATPIPQDYHQSPGNIQCCNGMTCFNPCPYPMMHSPVFPVHPILVPVQSYFEPVIHDHPPLEEIKRIIKADKRRKKKQRHISCGSETDYSDTSSSETDNFEYYNDFTHVNG